MIKQHIKDEMQATLRAINIEEAAKSDYDHKYVRQLWDKYHRLNELLKVNDKEGANS